MVSSALSVKEPDSRSTSSGWGGTSVAVSGVVSTVCSENSVTAHAFSTGLMNSMVSTWRSPSGLTCQSRICSP